MEQVIAFFLQIHLSDEEGEAQTDLHDLTKVSLEQSQD